MMLPEVSLVIGAYNCEDEIGKTLEEVQRYFKNQPYSHEVIVVNDGSSDGTEAILRIGIQGYPELRVFTNERNQGKGYSVKRGIREARGQFVFYTDADHAYPLEGLTAFLELLWNGMHQVVVGSRVHTGSLFHLHPRYFRYVYRRHLMSRFFNRLVRNMLGIQVMDTQCGFKGFTKEAAQAIFSMVRVSGFAFDVEVLLIAQRLGLQIMEIPVTFAYSGEVSTVRMINNAAQALVDLGRIYWWDCRGTYGKPY